jgi:hypothetical protein
MLNRLVKGAGMLLVAVILCRAPAAHAAINTGLVSFWKLNEASGSRSDSVGTNTLTETSGSVASTSGKLGSAGQFGGGSTAYLSIPNNSSFNTGGGDFSISLWVYLDNRTGTQVFASKYSGGGYALYYESVSHAFVFSTYAGSNFAIGTALGDPATGTWYHLVGVHDSVTKTNTIRINDQYTNTVTAVTDQPDTTGPFTIGAFSTGAYTTNGRIDAVGFWNRTLTSGEITSLYNSGTGLELSGTPDITAPTVSITAPTASSTVSGSSVSLSATSTDNVAVAGVTFYVDGVLQGSEDTSSPYGLSWNSTATSSGTHSVLAVARDTSNNYATSSPVSFTVDNTPVTFAAAAQGVTNNSVTLDWITNKLASALVQFGPTAGYGSTTAETDISPRMTGHAVTIPGLLSCTQYHYQLQGTDSVGNTGTSTDASFSTYGCAGGAIPLSIGTSTMITTSVGGTSNLTQASTTLSVTIPVNSTATTSSFSLQIKPLDGLGTLGTPLSSLRVAGTVFDVRAVIDATTTVDSFTAPITISTHYSASDVNGLIPSSLRLYNYHGGAWLPLTGCVVDTTAMTVTCTTLSFSTFALFGTAPATTDSSSISNTGSHRADTVTYGCKDVHATNFNYFSAPKPELCRYAKSALAASTTTLEVRDLSTKVSGEDVRLLQRVLNTHGYRIATTGSGSLNNESTVFGARTKIALVKYQQNRGITPATGYFGPLTRAAMKAANLQGLWW